MRTVSRPVKLMLTAAIGLAMSLAFSLSPASASSATWDLLDEEQRLCVPAGQPHRYFILAPIAGSWDATLEAELQNLPEGGALLSYTDSVPPGDNGSEYLVDIGYFIVLPGLEHGEHHATLSVTDGTVTQTRPIVFDAGDGWSC